MALEAEKYLVQDHDLEAISPGDKCQDQSPAPAPDQALVPALAEADQGTRFEQMPYSFSLDCNEFRAGFGVHIAPPRKHIFRCRNPERSKSQTFTTNQSFEHTHLEVRIAHNVE